MQQYIFRGLTADNKWVYGSLIQRVDGIGKLSLIEVQDKDGEIIVHQVKDDSVGMLSAHELKLYVGDVVNYVTGNPSYCVNAVVEFGEYETCTYYKRDNEEVDCDIDKHFGFYINDGKSKRPLGSLWLQKIGNCFDNPELINPTAQEQL